MGLGGNLVSSIADVCVSRSEGNGSFFGLSEWKEREVVILNGCIISCLALYICMISKPIVGIMSKSTETLTFNMKISQCNKRLGILNNACPELDSSFRNEYNLC